jgi:hypothetical protein
MTAMRELDIETIRVRRSPVTHFVAEVREPWTGRNGVARTFCGREWSAELIEPRKFSTVRSWCDVCYRSRLRAIQRAIR